MHALAGWCSRRLGLAAALAIALGGLTAGAASPSTSTRAAGKPLTPAERKMGAVIQAWSARLNRNDNRGLAELYALPTIIVQSPYAYRLKTRSQVALWFSLLPCAGTVTSVSYHGKFATAVFRLGNRGAKPCDDPGGLAAARFEIVKDKIVSWAQVPVPKGAKTTPQVA